MGVKSFIGEEAKEGFEIAKRFKRRDFSGNSGKVMKNSFWQIATTLTAKIGSLLFTIVLINEWVGKNIFGFNSSLMGPEIYGLYGLALSTILIFSMFNDLGIGGGMNVFVARLIDKRPGKAKGYFYYLIRYKICLIIITSLLIAFCADFLANGYYNKPIYYALLAGAIYLPIQVLSGFIGPLFNLRNDFKPQFVKEIITQVSRLTLLPLAIIYLLKTLPKDEYLFWVFIILAFCNLLAFVYIWGLAKLRHPFGKSKPIKLLKKEKSEAWKFILPLSVTGLSGIFFGYIDQIMLGHYVSGAFLGFYQVAFNLIASAGVLIGFGSAAVFPILARLKGKKLEKGFKKARVTTLMISLAAFIFTVVVAKYVILFVSGQAFLTAYYYIVPFSLLLISFPMIALYQTYYMSQERSKLVAILLVGSTVLNVLLNYVLINLGLTFGGGLEGLTGLGGGDVMFWGVMGACVATITSRWVFMEGLVLGRRRRVIKN
jgi:O-antigen/teichoic acid export membrane protein